MGKFWCKQCSTFVEESKIERLKHEKSARHQAALNKKLRDLHAKNKTIERELAESQRELARINQELKLKSGGDGAKKTAFKIHKPAKKSMPNNHGETATMSPTIPEWKSVTHSSVSEERSAHPASPKMAKVNSFKKKETVADREVNNWNFAASRSIEDDLEDEGLTEIKFKSRKVAKR